MERNDQNNFPLAKPQRRTGAAAGGAGSAQVHALDSLSTGHAARIAQTAVEPTNIAGNKNIKLKAVSLRTARAATPIQADTPTTAAQVAAAEAQMFSALESPPPFFHRSRMDHGAEEDANKDRSYTSCKSDSESDAKEPVDSAGATLWGKEQEDMEEEDEEEESNDGASVGVRSLDIEGAVQMDARLGESSGPTNASSFLADLLESDGVRVRMSGVGRVKEGGQMFQGDSARSMLQDAGLLPGNVIGIGVDGAMGETWREADSSKRDREGGGGGGALGSVGTPATPGTPGTGMKPSIYSFRDDLPSYDPRRSTLGFKGLTPTVDRSRGEQVQVPMDVEEAVSRIPEGDGSVTPSVRSLRSRAGLPPLHSSTAPSWSGTSSFAKTQGALTSPIAHHTSFLLSPGTIDMSTPGTAGAGALLSLAGSDGTGSGSGGLSSGRMDITGFPAVGSDGRPSIPGRWPSAGLLGSSPSLPLSLPNVDEVEEVGNASGQGAEGGRKEGEWPDEACASPQPQPAPPSTTGALSVQSAGSTGQCEPTPSSDRDVTANLEAAVELGMRELQMKLERGLDREVVLSRDRTSPGAGSGGESARSSVAQNAVSRLEKKKEMPEKDALPQLQVKNAFHSLSLTPNEALSAVLRPPPAASVNGSYSLETTRGSEGPAAAVLAKTSLPLRNGGTLPFMLTVTAGDCSLSLSSIGQPDWLAVTVADAWLGRNGALKVFPSGVLMAPGLPQSVEVTFDPGAVIALSEVRHAIVLMASRAHALAGTQQGGSLPFLLSLTATLNLHSKFLHASQDAGGETLFTIPLRASVRVEVKPGMVSVQSLTMAGTAPSQPPLVRPTSPVTTSQGQTGKVRETLAVSNALPDLRGHSRAALVPAVGPSQPRPTSRQGEGVQARGGSASSGTGGGGGEWDAPSTPPRLGPPPGAVAAAWEHANVVHPAAPDTPSPVKQARAARAQRSRSAHASSARQVAPTDVLVGGRAAHAPVHGPAPSHAPPAHANVGRGAREHAGHGIPPTSTKLAHAHTRAPSVQSGSLLGTGVAVGARVGPDGAGGKRASEEDGDSYHGEDGAPRSTRLPLSPFQPVVQKNKAGRVVAMAGAGAGGNQVVEMPPSKARPLQSVHHQAAATMQSPAQPAVHVAAPVFRYEELAAKAAKQGTAQQQVQRASKPAAAAPRHSTRDAFMQTSPPPASAPSSIVGMTEDEDQGLVQGKEVHARVRSADVGTSPMPVGTIPIRYVQPMPNMESDMDMGTVAGTVAQADIDASSSISRTLERPRGMPAHSALATERVRQRLDRLASAVPPYLSRPPSPRKGGVGGAPRPVSPRVLPASSFPVHAIKASGTGEQVGQGGRLAAVRSSPHKPGAGTAVNPGIGPEARGRVAVGAAPASVPAAPLHGPSQAMQASAVRRKVSASSGLPVGSGRLAAPIALGVAYDEEGNGLGATTRIGMSPEQARRARAHGLGGAMRGVATGQFIPPDDGEEQEEDTGGYGGGEGVLRTPARYSDAPAASAHPLPLPPAAQADRSTAGAGLSFYSMEATLHAAGVLGGVGGAAGEEMGAGRLLTPPVTPDRRVAQLGMASGGDAAAANRVEEETSRFIQAVDATIERAQAVLIMASASPAVSTPGAGSSRMRSSLARIREVTGHILDGTERGEEGEEHLPAVGQVLAEAESERNTPQRMRATPPPSYSRPPSAHSTPPRVLPHALTLSPSAPLPTLLRSMTGTGTGAASSSKSKLKSELEIELEWAQTKAAELEAQRSLLHLQSHLALLDAGRAAQYAAQEEAQAAAQAAAKQAADRRMWLQNQSNAVVPPLSPGSPRVLERSYRGASLSASALGPHTGPAPSSTSALLHDADVNISVNGAARTLWYVHESCAACTLPALMPEPDAGQLSVGVRIVNNGKMAVVVTALGPDGRPLPVHASQVVDAEAGTGLIVVIPSHASQSTGLSQDGTSHGPGELLVPGMSERRLVLAVALPPPTPFTAPIRVGDSGWRWLPGNRLLTGTIVLQGRTCTVESSPLARTSTFETMSAGSALAAAGSGAVGFQSGRIAYTDVRVSVLERAWTGQGREGGWVYEERSSSLVCLSGRSAFSKSVSGAVSHSQFDTSQYSTGTVSIAARAPAASGLLSPFAGHPMEGYGPAAAQKGPSLPTHAAIIGLGGSGLHSGAAGATRLGHSPHSRAGALGTPGTRRVEASVPLPASSVPWQTEPAQALLQPALPQSKPQPAPSNSASVAVATPGLAFGDAPAHGPFTTSLGIRTIFFPPTGTGAASVVKLQLCNTSSQPLAAVVALMLAKEADLPHAGNTALAAFRVKPAHASFILQPRKFCMLPISFSPPALPQGFSLENAVQALLGPGVGLSGGGSLTYNAVLQVSATPVQVFDGADGGGDRPAAKLLIRALLVGETVIHNVSRD